MVVVRMFGCSVVGGIWWHVEWVGRGVGLELIQTAPQSREVVWKQKRSVGSRTELTKQVEGSSDI